MILLIVGMIGVAIGLLAQLVFGVWLLVIAFQTSMLWGFGSLLVPFVGLIFTIMNWERCWKPFVGYVVSTIIMIGGSVMIAGGIAGMKVDELKVVEGAKPAVAERADPSVVRQIENLKFASFCSENKDYSVDLPAAAQPSSHLALDECLAGDGPGGSLLVGSTSLPDDATDAVKTQACLDAAVDRLVGAFGATAQSRQVTGIGFLAGRQVEGPMQDPELGLMKLVAYADPKRHRVYVLIATGKEYFVKSSAADRFFKSFKISGAESAEHAVATVNDRGAAGKPATAPGDFLSAANHFSKEEMSRKFVRYCFQSPLDEPSLTYYVVAPKDWHSTDIRAAARNFKEVSQAPTQLGELDCDSPHVTEEAWFVQQPTALGKFFDSYCLSLGFKVVDKKESTNRIEALVKYDTPSVKGMLARLTFVRNDKNIFWLSGCAPESEFPKWSNTFAVGALTFSPVGCAPAQFPDVATKTVQGTQLQSR